MEKKIVVKSLKEMNALAAKVAKTLKGGEVLALTGELGSGKTTFVKGLAKALGVKTVVQSPTFLLMKCYPVVHGPLSMVHSLCHVDAYRIKSPRELLTIGAGEKIEDKETATVIEWADLVTDIIPKDARWIKFEHGTNDSQRIVNFK